MFLRSSSRTFKLLRPAASVARSATNPLLARSAQRSFSSASSASSSSSSTWSSWAMMSGLAAVFGSAYALSCLSDTVAQSEPKKGKGKASASAPPAAAAPAASNLPSDTLPPEIAAQYSGRYRPDLPTFSIEKVKEHTEEENRLWVTYRGGVYDVTDFAKGHPGGVTRIQMVGGTDLEIYWREVYPQHYRQHVIDFLERYRIGNLTPQDAAKMANEFYFENPYANDPVRVPDLLGAQVRPWCGEARIELLSRQYFTPNELFYVRNHLPVPLFEDVENEYELIVKGNGIKGEHKFTLEDLRRKFKKYEVASTLQCAGNRREDFHTGNKKIFIAPHWVIGALSCALWGGPRLRDVLRHCGLDVDKMARGELDRDDIQHVQFEGYDQDETGLTYGGSIPIDKAVDPLGDCLVAMEMNGQPLPRDHGFPVRALSPGHAGARQCKWLHNIILSDKESDRPWHQKSYRTFAPDISFEEHLSKWPHGIRFDQAQIVQELPIQSFICSPHQGMILAGKDQASGDVPKEITVRGVAWSGGGKSVARVDVSLDGGKNFTAAEIERGPIKQRRNRQWAWVQFEKKLPLPAETVSKLRRGENVTLDLTSKAINSDCNVQPESPDPYYNARGVAINHWYHVLVGMDPQRASNMPLHNPEFGNTPTGGQFFQKWNPDLPAKLEPVTKANK